MKLRMLIYNFLVNRHPAIQKKYYKLRAEKQGLSGRMYAWFSLLWMNLRWALGNRTLRDDGLYPDENKKILKEHAESFGTQTYSPEELAEKLLQHDVISFDIFDTLIMRSFVAPTDLFFAVGSKLGIPDFEAIRRTMEWRARQKEHEKSGTYEVTLEDIYREMEEQAGIPADRGMELEMETELSFCFGNPYMLAVFDILAKKNKNSKIICTSDMYLGSDFLKRLLEKAGYTGIDRLFVSCEERASKSDKSLYRKVRAAYGDVSYIHVGDNPQSDGKHAREAGFDSVLYKNVNISGMPYRAEDLSIISGSLYRGIVNSRIYNGLHTYSKDYELGFVYGGYFVLGYCQYIHAMAKQAGWDKLLFLSRDGDIVKQVYDRIYGNEIPTEYVYWSRTAATKLGAEFFKFDYLRRFIDHKVNQEFTLQQVMDSAELGDMLPEMLQTFPAFVEKLLASDKVFDMRDTAKAQARREAVLTGETQLTEKNAWLVREYLLAKWEQVVAHYEEGQKAGQLYYENVLRGCRKAAAVDVGWAGSGAIVLNRLVNEKWKLDCEITGIVAGTNTYNNAEPNASEQFLYEGKLLSYMYSQENNREFWKWHNPGKDHNLAVELLLSSKEGSFKGFVLDETSEQGYRLLFKKPDCKPEKVAEIQQGVLDFAEDYCRYIPEDYRQVHAISGGDAYAVLKVLLQSKISVELEMGI